MRINYPESIKKEFLALEPYLMYDGEKYVVKPDAPEGTEERYKKVHEDKLEFRRQHAGF